MLQGEQLRLPRQVVMKRTLSNRTLTQRGLKDGTGYMVLLMMSTRYLEPAITAQP